MCTNPISPMLSRLPHTRPRVCIRVSVCMPQKQQR